MALCKDHTISQEYDDFYKNLPVFKNENPVSKNEGSDDDEISLQAMTAHLSKRRK